MKTIAITITTSSTDTIQASELGITKYSDPDLLKDKPTAPLKDKPITLDVNMSSANISAKEAAILLAVIENNNSTLNESPPHISSFPLVTPSIDVLSLKTKRIHTDKTTG